MLRRKSITMRITLWFSAMLAVLVTLTFLVFRIVSASILEKTIRSYLLSSVEANVDKILYIDAPASVAAQEAADQDSGDLFFDFGEGCLEIDGDFLDEIYDVDSGLYTSEGRMLYGKNPLPMELEEEGFTSSRVFTHKSGGTRYFIYDRKLSGEGLDGLWIRGIVPLSSAEKQLGKITHTTILFIPVLLVLGSIGGFLIVHEMLRPLHKIEKTASEITMGKDLHRRIETGYEGTELENLVKAFNGMLDRLERSFEAEKRFTSDASHELRTPMSVILAQTELTLSKERKPAEYRRALTVIERHGKRMSAMIGMMLDYTRLEQRAGEYQFEDLDLSELAESVAHDMALIQKKNISIETEIEPGIHISGNPLLMTRVIQNLIDNAYKYGRENGHILVGVSTAEENAENQTEAGIHQKTGKTDKTFKTEERQADRFAETDGASALQTGRRAVLFVQDDGIGISPEDTEKIFDRFYRCDPARSGAGDASGSGLGLSIVKKIVEMHGGSIRVESIPEKGSKFFVSLRIL